VLVAVSLDRADDTARQVDLTLVIAGLGALAVLVLAGWWVFRLGLRPITDVTDVATAIAGGELDRRVPERAPNTEAGELGRAFNVMVDARQASEDRLRRFVADASHELRTPVAAIRAFADLYRQGGLDADEALADAMRRIGQEGARMSGLVDDLLLLARLDEGRPLVMARLDMEPLLADAVLDASVTHPSRHVSLDVDGDLTVDGDEERLRQAVGNLVANAMTHTPDGTDVVVRGRHDGDGVVVEVVDHGPGMTPEAAAQAFDRFWRGDASRSRARGGSGLGLAIVKAIVEAHGGSATLIGQPGAGTTARLRLPAHTQSTVKAPAGPNPTMGT
jgi:two-component system OmpR family sensor kinase